MKFFYLVSLLFLICAGSNAQESLEKEKKLIGSFAPDFTANSLNNETISLKSLKGKIVVLTFWHIHCGACWLEIPDLNRIKEEYQGDVEVLSITTDTENALWELFDKTETGYKMKRKFHGNNEYNYPIIPDGEQMIKEYKVDFYPTTYYIDKEGIIRKVLPYFISYEGSGMKTNYQWIKDTIEEIKKY